MGREENKCVQNRCKCARGTPATKDCFKHKAQKCSKCNRNFGLTPNGKCRKCKSNEHKKNDRCHKNVCHCPNGEAATRDCFTHNSLKCKCCKYGFKWPREG